MEKWLLIVFVSIYRKCSKFIKCIFYSIPKKFDENWTEDKSDTCVHIFQFRCLMVCRNSGKANQFNFVLFQIYTLHRITKKCGIQRNSVITIDYHVNQHFECERGTIHFKFIKGRRLFRDVVINAFYVCFSSSVFSCAICPIHKRVCFLWALCFHLNLSRKPN